MMHTTDEVRQLLDELELRPAHLLESQILDFKEWNSRSMKQAVDTVIECAVCMANGGGGTVVFGVNDKRTGRGEAILGAPPEVDVNLLKKAVYDSTDPKLTPVIDELRVREGTGRLLIMHIFGGLPPYTDTQGTGKVRIGADCQPLTGSLRRSIMVETGETDRTAVYVPGSPHEYISAAAMEHLRNAARQERAPTDLLQRSDLELLEALGVLRRGQLTIAGVILAGNETALREFTPGYTWTHLRMQSDTRYSDRGDGQDALIIALGRLLDRIMADNPITTIEQGMFHFEYRTYPEVALREVLLNALCHTDFRLAGPILVKQYSDRLEISNPGGFIGGISPQNILHHPPVSRNPCLVDALAKLRLVNRSNLGIGRMFEALLIEGKEPPLIAEQGDAVTVTFRRWELSPAFRLFVAEESQAGRMLDVDRLLVMQHLLHHPEIDTATAARLCQRPDRAVRETLNDMEQRLNYLERGGSGRGTYWALTTDMHRRLAGLGHPERSRRIDWEAAKMRILSVLKQRAERSEPGLSNAEIRQIAHLDRNQVVRLMQELRSAHPEITKPGKGKGARYAFDASSAH